jgi:alkanesulfonate monooxygenase SsuD/methylene tetrahydromethanopterin reductase-like flavin-dependent oxidoreductase (luciferase family)
MDELSGGRMIIGLGTSGPQVIEHFHGVKFNPPLTRMKEYIDIINTLMRSEPVKYSGKLFNLQRGFTLRFTPVRNHIPIYLATLNAKSVKLTAEMADGWLPIRRFRCRNSRARLTPCDSRVWRLDVRPMRFPCAPPAW